MGGPEWVLLPCLLVGVALVAGCPGGSCIPRNKQHSGTYNSDMCRLAQQVHLLGHEARRRYFTLQGCGPANSTVQRTSCVGPPHATIRTWSVQPLKWMCVRHPVVRPMAVPPHSLLPTSPIIIPSYADRNTPRVPRTRRGSRAALRTRTPRVTWPWSSTSRSRSGRQAGEEQRRKQLEVEGLEVRASMLPAEGARGWGWHWLGRGGDTRAQARALRDEVGLVGIFDEAAGC